MCTYLITTAEEESWPEKGEKVLFLGEWCKRYDREDEWSNFDSITAEPYAIKRKEKKDVNDYADKLFEILLSELVDELNKFHDTSYSERYWHILVGAWLRTYIKVIINSYNTLELALNNYNLTKTIVLDCADSGLTPQTYKEFMACVLHDDLWSHKVYANMLQHWSKLDLAFIQKTVEGKKNNQENKKKNRIIWKKAFKHWIIVLFKTLSFFKRDNDAVIISSYLPMLQEIQLQLALGQVPQLWSTPEVKPVDIDTKLRSRFFQDHEKYQGIECEVRRLIHTLIPVCYLEGYESLSNQVDNFPWPLKPKFIYTSNSFGSDEVFKLWTARKSELGVPYYVGQHGNSYGTLMATRTAPEITTCDKFFSWGWGGIYTNNNAVPAFVFKTVNRSHINIDRQGGLLLLCGIFMQKNGCQDCFYEHMLQEKDVLQFLSALGEMIKGKTTVRIHPVSQKRNTDDAYLWKLHHPSVMVDYGYVNIFKAISKNRLTVYSIDSTGVLENLSLNVPIVCFWRDSSGDLFPDAVPYYELLIDVGILHINPESAAEHIKKYWDNFDKWWDGEKVQNARKVFCNKYARQIENPVITLRNLLLQD